MRILIISSVYTGDSGGVATHVVTLARGLVRYIPDATVHVVTLASATSLWPAGDSNGYIRKNRADWKSGSWSVGLLMNSMDVELSLADS